MRVPLSRLRTGLVALLAFGAIGASAQSLGLSNYRLTGNYALDTLGGMGLEASAVTFARDRGSLFFVGDEGMGIVEISLTGATLGSMAFNWAGTGSTNNDAEGLAYMGGGQFVLVDERPQRAYRFAYQDGGTVALGSTPYATISNYSPSNIGIEGISFDARDGSFVTVKQDADGNPARGPQEVRAGQLSFAQGGGSTSIPVLFDASLLGLASLSDVQALSAVDRFLGTTVADNLLILSLDSRLLVEATRTGQVVGSLDISGITNQAIEGVTIDNLGNIYLVAEDSGTPNSRLFVLTTPVPEPETWAMMAAGLALLGWRARRRRGA
ncbi:MAG: SdiA-regulated domain-containing protein [Rhodoferax sp.]|nr:SdiA-regulated domain-containing protein [Rhodoferax sp.]